jgi:hypothetical protein
MQAVSIKPLATFMSQRNANAEDSDLFLSIAGSIGLPGRCPAMT